MSIQGNKSINYLSISKKLSWTIIPLVTLINSFPSFASTMIGSVNILDPDELIDGKTQASLGDLWLQWTIGLPKNNHPLVFDDNTDPLGIVGSQQKASINQPNDSVFFLGGIFGQSSPAPVTRTLEISAGKYLFFPLINQAVDNSSIANDPNDPNFFGNLPVDSGDPDGTDFVEDCFSTNPSVNPPSLRDCAASIINTTNDLFTTINGIDAESAIDLFAHRQKSPVPFSYSVPVDNLLGYTNSFFVNNPGNFQQISIPGTISPVVADGYWVALAPLAPGNYEINFGGISPFAIQDITYKLKVTPVPESNSQLAILGWGILGLGSLAFKSKKRSTFF
jgi:hypothetical protein